jgi:hypothetical protein
LEEQQQIAFRTLSLPENITIRLLDV